MPTLYKVLSISNSTVSENKLKELNTNPNIEIISLHDTIDFLEYLMDHKVDGILINTEISPHDALNLLEKISQDYENEVTPIVLVSNFEECKIFAEIPFKCNIIATFTCSNWNEQLANLLHYLHGQTSQTNKLKSELQKSEVRNVKDPLTGALNRYGAQDKFYDLSSRHKAYQEPFCLIMLDIDYFKNINDTYGHDIGDEVLINLTSLIKSSIRSNDSIIRLGGEEFLIFLSNVKLATAAEIAEKTRVALEFTPITPEQLNITSSFGVVEYKENEDLDSILKRVDILLYKAKTGGRNKVIVDKV